MAKHVPFAKSRALLLVCTLLTCSVATARDKSDVITLKNGDRIHGEIVKLEYGKLSLKTDNMGTLQIEWPAIAGVESQFAFDFEMDNGARHCGTIETSPEDGKLLVTDGERSISVAALNVSRIAAVEGNFWQRIDGSLSFGYNFAKSTDVKVLSTHFDASYRAPTIPWG